MIASARVSCRYHFVFLPTSARVLCPAPTPRVGLEPFRRDHSGVCPASLGLLLLAGRDRIRLRSVRARRPCGEAPDPNVRSSEQKSGHRLRARDCGRRAFICVRRAPDRRDAHERVPDRPHVGSRRDRGHDPPSRMRNVAAQRLNGIDRSRVCVRGAGFIGRRLAPRPRLSGGLDAFCALHGLPVPAHGDSPVLRLVGGPACAQSPSQGFCVPPRSDPFPGGRGVPRGLRSRDAGPLMPSRR